MKAPKSGATISKSWLEYVLQEHLGHPVAVTSFTVKPGAGPGDGFNSELVMVTVETTSAGDQVTKTAPHPSPTVTHTRQADSSDVQTTDTKLEQCDLNTTPIQQPDSSDVHTTETREPDSDVHTTLTEQTDSSDLQTTETKAPQKDVNMTPIQQPDSSDVHTTRTQQPDLEVHTALTEQEDSSDVHTTQIEKTGTSDVQTTPETKPPDVHATETKPADVHMTSSAGQQPNTEPGSQIKAHADNGLAYAKHTNRTFHLVAKFISQDPMSRETNIKFKTSLKEYLIYSEILRDLNELQASKIPEEPIILCPELIYGKCTDKEFVLVLENLKTGGFNNNDKRKGLGELHLKLAIESIARIHALSYVYNLSHNILKKHPCFRSVNEAIPAFISLLGCSVDNCIEFLKSSKETEALGKKLAAAKPGMRENIVKVLSIDPPFMCLAHGDYWNNNVMYKEGESGVIEKMMVIDWGNASFGGPIPDLQYMFNTSTTRDVRAAHLEDLLHHYHATFTRITTILGSPVPSWDYDTFRAKYEEANVVGFYFGCGLIQGTLSNSNWMNKEPSSSASDKRTFAPVKYITDGLKSTMARVVMSVMNTSVGKTMMVKMYSKLMKPITDELKAGTNQVMNNRLLGLVREMDEKGLLEVQTP